MYLEDKEQMAIISWSKLAHIPGTNKKISDYLIAIPNEGKRDPKLGSKRVRMGLKKGVSDLFLAYPVGGMHGCWIEMKKRRLHFDTEGEALRSVTEHQKDWQIRMKQEGYFTAICYGADEAMKSISTYLGIQR